MGLLTKWFNSIRQVEDLEAEIETLKFERDEAKRCWDHWCKEYWNERWELSDAIQKADKLEAQLLAERDGKTVDAQEPYRAFVDRLFVNKREGNDGLMHMAAGLSGEANEVLDHVKKVWVYNKPIDRENMIEELGDSFYYFTGLLILLGIELKDVIEANMVKLAKRYPNGYSDQAAIERKDKVA